MTLGLRAVGRSEERECGAYNVALEERPDQIVRLRIRGPNGRGADTLR